MVHEKEQKGIRWVHWLQQQGQLEFLLQRLELEDCDSGFQLFPGDISYWYNSWPWVSVSYLQDSTLSRVKNTETP